MRLAGTAIICVVAAFGAAFLVARASDHGSPAKTGATTAPRVPPVTAPIHTTTDAELVSEFTPVRTVLKRRPRPHRRHISHHPSSPAASSPANSVETTSSSSTAPATTTEPAPESSPPSDTPPAGSGGGGSGSSGGSTHKSHGGSGTTTIGG